MSCPSDSRSGTSICPRAALGTCGFVELGQEPSLDSGYSRFSSRLELDRRFSVLQGLWDL